MKMTMPAVPERLRDSGGFALAMAVFALVVLAAVVAGGYFSAAQEFQIGRGMRAVTSSFYASEMGIVKVVEDWDPVGAETLEPGDTLAIGPEQLAGGGRYSAIAVRVDDASDAALRYFYIEAAGRPPVPAQGERRQAILARARIPDLCCDAAVTTFDDTDTGGGPPSQVKVYGDDVGILPSGWGTACTNFPPLDLPAIRIPSVSKIDNLDRFQGDPKYIEDPSLDRPDVVNLGDLTFDEIRAFADFEFSGNHDFDGSSPSTINGKCNKEDPENWGAPNNASHPCFDFFPIIYVEGVLTLAGNGVAQGIILTGDDVHLAGGFEFYGLIFSRDDLELNGQSTVFGGAYVEENFQLNSAPAEFYFSNCAVQRAVRYSNLTRPVPLPDRPWVELF